MIYLMLRCIRGVGDDVIVIGVVIVIVGIVMVGGNLRRCRTGAIRTGGRLWGIGQGRLHHDHFVGR